MGYRTHDTLRKAKYIPAGSAFIQLSHELIASPVWRARSINCIRLIDFLLIEHMQHGGYENGNLIATYGQLEEFGIARRLIRETIAEAESIGLVYVERGGRKGSAMSNLNRFTLTFLPVALKENGSKRWRDAPHDWERTTLEELEKIKGKPIKKLTLR